jgi:hypothetical protein
VAQHLPFILLADAAVNDAVVKSNDQTKMDKASDKITVSGLMVVLPFLLSMQKPY